MKNKVFRFSVRFINILINYNDMEKITDDEIKRIAGMKNKKRPVTLYLDYGLVEDAREFLGNKKSVSQFVNDTLQQISDFLKERKKEQQEKEEENKSG